MQPTGCKYRSNYSPKPIEMNRIDRLKEFLAASPKDSFVRHALALEYVKIGEELEAKRQFEELLADDPLYIGSYYHLAKLLERIGDTDDAVRIYETGMQKAKESNDQHTYSELRSAYEELTY